VAGMRVVEVGRFRAATDSGRMVAIIQYQEYIPAGTLPDPDAEVEGLQYFRTSAGQNVNWIDSDTYVIVGTGEVVRRT